MKKVIFAVAMMLSFSAVYADEVKPVEPVHVTLVSVDTSKVGADITIAPSDFPNGVFVLVKEMFGERPVSAAIFSEKLRAKGFKITEKASDADVVIRVISSTLNFKDIDQNASSIAASKIDGVGGLIGAALLTGGFSLLVSDYSFLGNTKPVYSDMSVIIEPNNKKESVKSTVTSGTIKTDASNFKVTRASFEILTDAWLKAHLRKVDSAQAASAVSATQSLADSALTAKK